MITAIATLLASTTFIVWGTIIFIVLMTILLEFEKEGWTTTFFSLGMALWLWNFGGDIWAYVSTNPTQTLGFILTYVLMGVFWSIGKWNAEVKSVFNKAKEIRDSCNLPDNAKYTDGVWKIFIAKLNDAFDVRFYDNDIYEEIAKKLAPKASENKSIITAWIAYWPVSLAGTLLNNPFRKFFEMIYANISGIYDKITKHHQKNAFGK